MSIRSWCAGMRGIQRRRCSIDCFRAFIGPGSPWTRQSVPGLEGSVPSQWRISPRSACVDIESIFSMRAATGTTLPWIFGLPGILLLDARGIGQHELAQVHRAGCAEDASSVALCDEPRQVADVIEVRVGQND